jgi:sulfatase maturation enzyme AslB (radical SAM superfamily)
MKYNGVSLVVVYMGDTCNFDCKYCDRGYIKDVIGSQNLRGTSLSYLVKLLDDMIAEGASLRNFSFHGGEPFLYIKKIDRILDTIWPKLQALGVERFSMTTNGSLIVENEWFLKKWGPNFKITLSYDFNFQARNREVFDLQAMASLIRQYDSQIQFQFVVPIDDPEGFSLDTVYHVIKDMRSAGSNVINLIPLRHLRGATKFKVMVEDTDLRVFTQNFAMFIHTLYANGIKCYLDGNYKDIDKHYLDTHYKLILSPDGYMYPEFDFLEYQRPEYRVGQWILEDKPIIYGPQPEDSLLLDKCKTCSSKSLCGLKYLYSMFEKEPGSNCIEFYQIMAIFVAHMAELQTKPTMFHWARIDNV